MKGMLMTNKNDFMLVQKQSSLKRKNVKLSVECVCTSQLST